MVTRSALPRFSMVWHSPAEMSTAVMQLPETGRTEGLLPQDAKADHPSPWMTQNFSALVWCQWLPRTMPGRVMLTESCPRSGGAEQLGEAAAQVFVHDMGPEQLLLGEKAPGKWHRASPAKGESSGEGPLRPAPGEGGQKGQNFPSVMGKTSETRQNLPWRLGNRPGSGATPPPHRPRRPDAAAALDSGW